MIASHTKFSPDRFFAFVKKTYRNTSVSSLPEIEKMVSNSSISGKNVALPTVDSSGKRNVIWYNWSEFLSQYFTSIPAITKWLFNQIDRLLHIILTVPVTTSTAERSFSTLRRLKTYLRSTMTQTMLNNLMMLHIHKDRTDKLDICDIAKEFVAYVTQSKKTDHVLQNFFVSSKRF